MVSCNLTHESNVLIEIELFMTEINQCWDLFTIEALKSYLLELVSVFKIFYHDYHYSYPIQSFVYVVEMIEQMLSGQGYEQIMRFSNEKMMHLIGIAQYWMQFYTTGCYERYRQEQRNQQNLNHYLQQLINHYARLLFVRVDLAYQPENHQYINVERFIHDIKTLCNRISNQDTCFRDLQGYAWALEQGISKGYHCHLLLIYDGNRHQNDFGIGLQVSQCWNEITYSLGTAFVCNSPEYKAGFRQMGTLGIGMIHRDNPIQVTNALNTAQYLVNPEKQSQHLRAKPTVNTRTFSTGQFDVAWRRGI
ncbi:YagK/YfjJ domain-containing protein [Acinetobacter populi]|nr:inovirus-type Gp2 protein [Acinetobacter populi]